MIPSQPRGLRNYNPGNIEYTPANAWQGQVGVETGVSNPRFARFETMEHGVRAMTRLLQNYQGNYGLNTPNEIIGRWAPPSENDTGNYAHVVAAALGVSPDDPIDLSDQETMNTLVNAMIRMENGRELDPEVVRRGVAMAYDQDPDVTTRSPEEASRLGFELPSEERGLDPQGALAPVVPSAETLRGIRQAEEETEGVSIGEAFGAATEIHWVFDSLMELYGRPELKPDPDFKFNSLDPETQAELLDGLSEEEQEIVITESVSLAHAQDMRERVDRAKEMREIADSSSLPGWLVEMAALVADPVAILGSMSLGGGAVAAAKVSRLRGILAGALAGGATNLGLESVLAQADPLRNEWDLAIAGIGGSAFGSIGGALSRPGSNAARMGEIAEESLVHAGGVRRGEAPKVTMTVDENGVPRTLEVGEGKSFHASTLPSGDAGAAMAPREFDLTRAGDADIMAEARAFRPTKDDVWAQYDMYADVARSDHDVMAHLMGMLSPNPSGVYSKPMRGVGTAFEWKENYYQRHFGTFNRVLRSSYREYAKEQGVNWTDRIKSRADFYTEVGRAIRHDPGTYTTNPHINRAADEVRKIYQQALKDLKASGARGFENIPENVNYLPRFISADGLRKANKVFRNPVGVQRFVANAIRSANRNLTDDEALALADGWVHSALEARHGLAGKIPATSEKRLEELVQNARSRLGVSSSITDDDLKEFFQSAMRVSDGRPSRAKQRLRMDETYKAMTDDGGYFAVSDLFENNIEILTQEYLRQTGGLYGMARMGLKNANQDFEHMLQVIRRTAGEYGIQPGTKKWNRLESDIERLEQVKSMIMAQPRPFGSHGREINKWAQRALAYNFARLMGQVGLAQIPELFNVVMQSGIRATFKQMPIIPKLFAKAADGQLSQPFLREMENWVGIGLDGVNFTTFGRYDSEVGEQALDAGIDRFLRSSGRIVSQASLMTPINTIGERMGAAAISQRLADMALGKGRKLSARRLRSLGLDDQTADVVMDNIRRHAGFKQGPLTGNQLAQLNLDQWDPLAREAFIMSVQRFTRRAIQKSDPADMKFFMTTDTGRVLGQFLSFTQTAWAKQMLHMARMKDMESVGTFIGGTVGGLISYLLVTHSKALGKASPEDYLEENLTPEKILFGTMYRSSWPSYAYMAFMEPASWMLGLDATHAARTTGLSTSLSSPATELAYELFNLPYKLGATAARDDYDFDGRFTRGLLRLLPFQNMFGIGHALDRITDDG